MPGLEVTEWVVTLDPSEVAIARQELALNSLGGEIRIDQQGIDWGDAAISAFMADEKWGSSPVDYRVPNRIVTIPLGVGMNDAGQSAFDTARDQLHQKVALLQREGGWLKRERTGRKLYADVVNATLHEPDFAGATGAVEDGLVLTLECLPDFYGDEIVLDPIAGTGLCDAVLRQSGMPATILGDYPARVTMTVTDQSGVDQRGVLWGVRARYFDADPSAALALEAESLTPTNGATVVTQTGASGGSMVKQASLPDATWTPIVSLLQSGGAPLTHRGTYRVWARCYSATDTPQIRLAWGAGSLSALVVNDAATLPASGGFYLLDLGTIRIDEPLDGPNQWYGTIQAYPTAAGKPGSVDVIYLQPLDESAGKLQGRTAVSTLTTSLSASKPASVGADDASAGTVPWSNPTHGAVVDGSMASAEFDAGAAVSHYLKLTGFGFALPSDAVIQGIVASITRGEQQQITDAAVRLVKAGVVQTTDRSAGAAWDVTPESYGSPSDLWGASLAYTDVNNAGFGIAVAAQGAATVGSGGSGTTVTNSSAGPNNPATVTDRGAGNVSWVSLSGAESPGGGAAASNPMTVVGYVTDALAASNYGFAIPSDATILGIQVAALVRASGGISDSDVMLLRHTGSGQAALGANKAAAGAWPGSFGWRTWGGPTDMWSNPGMTPADINNSDFGVQIQARATALSSGAAVALIDAVQIAVYYSEPASGGGGTTIPAVAEVDGASVTVYYTESSVLAAPEDAVLYANQNVKLRTERIARSSGGVYGPVSVITGDLPRLPVSGLEGRAVEMFVKPSRGDLDLLADSASDPAQVLVAYRPCYLHRP